ncbi:MAG: class I SAM-dependent methyltransferase [Anaerolineales bacterium]
MERSEWLKLMQKRAEELYDRFSPRYWVTWGLVVEETHRIYLQNFLERVVPHGTILSAACGAGRFDGMLLEAGHKVVGIDQSAKMLASAKEHFPKVEYIKMALHEMNFQEIFEGVICMDAMEHICPEDYPGILLRFQRALKPRGVLYFTADREEDPDFDLQMYFKQGKALGLPLVFGEVADDVAFEQAMAMEQIEVPDELTDRAVYHYYPPLKKVRGWITQAGFVIEEEGAGSGFHHFVVRKR